MIYINFLNHWTDWSAVGLGTEYMPAGYMIDEIGMVHLRGTIINWHDDIHSTEELICLLPPLYRPHRSVNVQVPYDGGTASRRLYINGTQSPYPDGGVFLPNGVTGLAASDAGLSATFDWLSMDSISWWVGKERLRQL